MRTARIWGRRLTMQGSPWTFVVWREEFGGDLLSAIDAAWRSDPVQLEDFMKIAWALCKTADEATEPYDEWLEIGKWPEFSLAGEGGGAFVSVVVQAVEAELFRDFTARGRLKRLFRRAKGWLGGLPRRARPRLKRLLPR